MPGPPLTTCDQGATSLLALIDHLTTAPDLDTYAWRVCEGIGRLLPGLSVSYNELDPASGRAHAVIVPDPGPGWYRTYRPPFEAHLHDNPLVAHFQSTGDTRVRAWGDPGIGSVVGTTLDRTFYLPNGIRSQLAVLLPAPPGILIAIAVNRGVEGFTEAERRLLSLLRPHLVHAYRSVQLRADAHLLGSVLDRHGWAVVLVDDTGQVVGSTADAAAVARRYGLDAATGASLATGALRQVKQVIADYHPAHPAVPVPITGPWGTPVAVVVPSAVGPHVVLLREPSVTLAGLREAGLTNRQAQVAQGLLAGETNAQIATRLRITPATVRKHVEAILQRLDVPNRAAAVARIADLR